MYLGAHFFCEGTHSSYAIFIIPDLFISGIMKSSTEDLWFVLSLVYLFLSFLFMSKDYVEHFLFHFSIVVSNFYKHYYCRYSVVKTQYRIEFQNSIFHLFYFNNSCFKGIVKENCLNEWYILSDFSFESAF